MSKQRAVALAVVGVALALALVYWGHRVSWGVGASKPPKPSASGATQPFPGAIAPAVSVNAAAGGSEKSSSPPAAVTPLRSGEVLEFVADVAKLTNVANLRLAILEQRNFFGKSAWHLQALAHTENPLRMVFELDDQFDSYSDANTLSSLQYEMHLNERGEKVDSVQRMTSSKTERTPGTATETHVLPGTRDPLGFMQYLRTINWSNASEVRGPVYDGHNLYEVRAAFGGKVSNVGVPAGTFATSKIEIHVYQGGAELKDANFVLYLAENAARTPVLLEAVMPFATARVALAKVREP